MSVTDIFILFKWNLKCKHYFLEKNKKFIVYLSSANFGLDRKCLVLGFWRGNVLSYTWIPLKFSFYGNIEITNI